MSLSLPTLEGMGKKTRHFTIKQAEQLKVTSGFKLADIDPDSTPGLTGKNAKEEAADLFDDHDEEFADLQEQMYAQHRVNNGAAPAVLLVLQGMDTSGKGGIVRHVIGSMDPQGVSITGFGKPTAEEASHDFLWRIRKAVPTPGIVGVFDRSHYEDVLVQRVHNMAPPEEIERRYGAIVDFENQLNARNVHIVKVMLHISKEKQTEHLLERIERPDKHWKYNPGDIDERLLWDQYQEAYEIALKRTSTSENPWYVVPADHRWYSRLVVKGLMLEKMRSLGLAWPEADFDPEVEKERLKNS